MKVLHLISSSGLYGAEKVLLELLRQQKKQGLSVTLGIFNNKLNPHLELVEEAKKLGVETHVFDCAGQFDFSTITALRKCIKENNIEIIHSHGYKSDMYAWVATWFLKVKLVATCHGRTEKPGVKFYQQLDTFALKRFHHIVIVSEKLKETMTREGIPKENMIVIENGIDVDRIAGRGLREAGYDERTTHNASRITNLRRSLNIAETDKVIGCIGRLSLEKGHQYLLEAVRDIRASFSNIKCLIVGDGESRKALEMKARDLNLRNIIFTGVRNDIAELLGIIDIFAMPSLTEGVSIALLEAMAAKKPIVATKVGAIPQLIDDSYSGLLVEARDTRQLGFAILEFLHNSEKASLCGYHAYEKVKKDFSSEKMAREYKKVYESLK